MRWFTFLFLLTPFFVCDLPKERYQQFRFTKEITTKGDTHFVYLRNEIAAPLRIRSAGTQNNGPINFKFILPAFSDTTFSLSNQLVDSSEIHALTLSISLGDHTKSEPDSLYLYQWPFPKGRSYNIMQAYNGSYSHNSDYSRFAIDFEMAEGDTITAAREGVIIGLIEDYKVGGRNKKYRDFANYITILHPDGTMSQYVHLSYKGALVELGDTVSAGGAIALSGNTGFSSAPHLHFNTIRALDWDNTVSFPVIFEQQDGATLKKGLTVSH